MKRFLLTFSLIVSHFSFLSVAAQSFCNTPLLEALQVVARQSEDYTIDILSDSLAHLQTSAEVNNLSVPDAVKRICKGLPVRVKRKGKSIALQYRAEKDFTNQIVELTGCVEDGFLGMPLPQAKISVLRADSSVVVDSAEMVHFYKSQRLIRVQFSAKVSAAERVYLVRAQLDGYADVWQRVDIADPSQELIDIPRLKMRKVASRMLKEVEVTATKVKMFYRGDTLIYDATAFQLPEGSMLDELIHQLPGVTLNDKGEIFVNGRKVDELLLGARTFFGGNKKVLMENLPYYTVKELKVYEKQTDLSRALGYDAEPRRYVMDVYLKDEYSEGYIANVEAAGGTEERWLGRGFLLGFTDRLRFTVLANANNVNESGHIGQSNQWTPNRAPQSVLTTRSVAGEVSYQSADKNVEETFRADYSSSSDESAMRQHREQFLAGLTPTALSETFNRAGTKKLTLHNFFSFTNPDPKSWLLPEQFRMNVGYNYTRRDGWFNSAFDEWSDSLTVSQRAVGMNEGRAWSGNLECFGAFKVGRRQHITVNVKAEHVSDESEQASRYTMQHHDASMSSAAISSQQHNASSLFNRTTSITAHAGWNREVAKNVNLLLTDFISYHYQHSRDNLYHPDTLLLPSQIAALAAFTDPANSYDSRNSYWSNSLVLRIQKVAQYKHPEVPLTIDYDRWLLQIGTPFRHERLHYQRGGIDTLARQTVFLPNVNFSYRNVWKKGMRDFRFNYLYDEVWNNLLDRISFRDDSQPLMVKLGNPDLKRPSQSRFRAEYYARTAPRKAQYNASASFNYYHRIVAQSLTYDPASGVYTYKPMNVSGTWDAHAHFDTYQYMDKNRFWSWHVNGGIAWNHAKDHAMLAGDTLSRVNTVNTLILYSGGNIQFSKDKLNVRVVGNVNLRRSRGKMQDFSTLNALDFHYGFEARYTLPRINTTLAADGTMYSRRGYGSSELNTDDFILNASVSQPLLKGKLIARLEGFDLLHQLSNTKYDVNALGRTVTWHRSLPHYLMLHLVYHWNKNPKK